MNKMRTGNKKHFIFNCNVEMFDLLLFGSANLFLRTLKIDFHFLSGTEMGGENLAFGLFNSP